MQMAIDPAHDGLEGVVETTQTKGIWGVNSPPDRRTNLLESDPEFRTPEAGSSACGSSFQLSSPSLVISIITAGAAGESRYIAMRRLLYDISLPSSAVSLVPAASR